MSALKVDLFHNIRWARYKAGVFSQVHRQSEAQSVSVRIIQIADTNARRVALAAVDMSCHDYPHELLFPGSYGDVPLWRRTAVLWRKVLTSDADVVAIPGFDRFEYWGMLVAAICSDKKRVVFCDSTLRDRRQSWIKGLLKRAFFSLCDGFFGYGRRAREFLVSYGASPQRIYQRVQAAALPPDYSELSVRSTRVAVHRSSSCNLVFVGRLSDEKSLDILLSAHALLLRAVPEAVLKIIGDGPLMDSLKALAASLGLERAVLFLGGMPAAAVYEEVASATCLVLPSRSEPWGLVVNEALHFGCPVVVSDNCGCVPELVIDGVTGFSFKTDDSVDLAEKIQAAIRMVRTHSGVADDCIEAVREFSPANAATQILAGFNAVGRACR